MSKLVNRPLNRRFVCAAVEVFVLKTFSSVASLATMFARGTSFDTAKLTFFFQKLNWALCFVMDFVSFGRVNCFAALIAVAMSVAALVAGCSYACVVVCCDV